VCQVRSLPLTSFSAAFFHWSIFVIKTSID
jgi:hypothetical protein